jgi:hypothetical protein
MRTLNKYGNCPGGAASLLIIIFLVQFLHLQTIAVNQILFYKDSLIMALNRE